METRSFKHSIKQFMKFFLICFSLLILNSQVFGQIQDTCHIRLISKVSSDSIVIRWAPDHASAWEKALKVGYIICLLYTSDAADE